MEMAEYYNKFGFLEMKEKFNYKSSENTFRCMCNNYHIYHKSPLPRKKRTQMSNEVKERLRKHFLGTRWMNNGKIKCQVKPD